MSVLLMKTLYFDCFAGASGDMILGAMVAAGVDQETFKQQLSLLHVSGYTVDFEIVDRSGISATYAKVQTKHEHAHRHLRDILKLINDSRLSDSVKDRAASIFSRLGEAEARVHNIPIEKVHFHEVGALDAIIDVVGAAICFEFLGIERFVSSPLHVGSGTVDMEHGRFPVPPPAVAELLKGVPFYSTDIAGELLTPTGAAIITTVASEFGPVPQLKLEQTGYGAGTRTYEKFPNVLRVLIGNESDERERALDEKLLVLETNVDDMSPKVFGYVMERAFGLGALDCYFTPVQMKKNRPGILLTVLCRRGDREKFMQMLFEETTTLGIRSYEVDRRALARQTVRVETQYGPIDVKVARLGDKVVNAMPEYEQCRLAAAAASVPLRVVEEAARAAFAKSDDL
ncbi:MAG: nickel pincer cofactor biosynthesis protein LarC [Pyrinomonadaceae bacterium]|nr:nickel pincer cofactor biosynthesis protein LarC [Pyrinomonadaceae bacterium]